MGAALVAVGGYGRAELAPYSDLDVVLVSDEGVDLGAVAEKVWYPIWDSGSQLDHSVRTLPEMVTAADDLRVASGLLDIRHLAGDPNLTLRLRTTMLTHWRRGAKERLPELHRMVRSRHELIGELAHLSVPDLKESEGGLRDATMLKALVATWLVDVPHTDLERSPPGAARRPRPRARHRRAGHRPDRARDVVGPRRALGPVRASRASAPPRCTCASSADGSPTSPGSTWRRVDDVLARPTSVKRRGDPPRALGQGVALARGEVVLDKAARRPRTPCSCSAPRRQPPSTTRVLAPPTAARLVREGAALPDPWPAEARQLLVRLLPPGRGLLGVWETLEETGALAGFLPEWERIRLLPHASVIHRFTVDRHVVETCIEAATLIRRCRDPTCSWSPRCCTTSARAA